MGRVAFSEEAVCAVGAGDGGERPGAVVVAGVVGDGDCGCEGGDREKG